MKVRSSLLVPNLNYFLSSICSEKCSRCSYPIAIVYGDYICQVPKRTKYTYVSNLFCLKKFNLFEFCVMNRPKSKSLFRSKYMRHFALKSNTVQVGCQWHWMFPTAKFHWDQQKVIFNLRAILDRKASSLCCNIFFIVSYFHWKYLRHIPLKSNMLQAGCQWLWMSPVLVSAKLH